MTRMSRALAVLAGIAGGAVASSNAHAEVLEQVTFHDGMALVSFRTSSPLDCGGGQSATLRTHVVVNGFEFTDYGTGDVQTNTVFVALDQRNGCTGAVVFGFGDLPGGYSQHAFSSALLSGTVQLADI